MSNLSKAIQMAVDAHSGQKRFSNGEPYILHPLRIMMKFSDEKHRIVAILHDTIEDTHLTIEDLKKAGFSEDVIKALNLLTRKEGQLYNSYIDAIANDRLACDIKIEDLQDNMNISKFKYLEEKHLERIKKYHSSFKFLKLKYPHDKRGGFSVQ